MGDMVGMLGEIPLLGLTIIRAGDKMNKFGTYYERG